MRCRVKFLLILTFVFVPFAVFPFQNPCAARVMCECGLDFEDLDYQNAIHAEKIVQSCISMAASSLLMYRDNRQVLMYAADGLFVTSLSFFLIGRATGMDKELVGGVGVVSYVLPVFSFLYSTESWIEGVTKGNKEQTLYGVLGFLINAAMLFMPDSRCPPCRKCTEKNSLYPVFGPNFAGLDCRLKF
jgi:hypothetical protein